MGIYCEDIGIEFRREKCATLLIKDGKRHIREEIELPNEEKIRSLGKRKSTEYLGILEADAIKHEEVKEKIEYLTKTRKLLATKLYIRNLIRVINT